MAPPSSRPKTKLPRLPGRPDSDESFATLAGEFKDLVVGYAKQETLAPLKDVGRFAAWGIAGAILLGLGVVLVTLAVIRALQGELPHHLGGSLTWVPYAGGLVFALLVAGLAASRIGKGQR